MRCALDVVPPGLHTLRDSGELLVIGYIVDLSPYKTLRIVRNRILVYLFRVLAARLQ